MTDQDRGVSRWRRLTVGVVIVAAILGRGYIREGRAWLYGLQAYLYGFPLVVMHLTKAAGTAVSDPGEIALFDMWSNVFASIGPRTTGTGAASFLLAGLSWQGAAPARLMKDNAPTTADAPMVEKLRWLGVEPGQDFDISTIDPHIARGLQRPWAPSRCSSPACRISRRSAGGL